MMKLVVQKWIPTFWLTSFLTGCAVSGNSAKKVVTTCNIPDDQKRTISGEWAKLPIPIAFAKGEFNSGEISAITAAADSWNSFFQISAGQPSLNYGNNPQEPRTSEIPDSALGSKSYCSYSKSSVIVGTIYVGNVVIYKVGKWPYASSAIALTNFCVTSNPNSNENEFPLMRKAVVEINYQNYFIEGTRQPDLQSILLHELGHVHGLNHSCDVSGKAGFPRCNQPNIDPSYLTAVMFPTFSFNSSGTGQQKRDLQPNDQSRANCLYNRSTPR